MKNKNRISPLDELRQEKEIVKRQCEESEIRLAYHWEYFSDNTGSLVFNSLVGGIFHKLGFKSGNLSKSDKQSSSLGLTQGVFSGVSTFAPLVWDLVQPLLWNFALRKIKSVFSFKKKKK